MSSPNDKDHDQTKKDLDQPKKAQDQTKEDHDQSKKDHDEHEDSPKKNNDNIEDKAKEAKSKKKAKAKNDDNKIQEKEKDVKIKDPKEKLEKEKKDKNKKAPELTLEQKIKSSQDRILELREKNDELRDQLKGLCSYLSTALEKKKIGKVNSSTEIEDPFKLKQFLEKTIENNEKQKDYYKKYLEKLEEKGNKNTAAPPQRIDELINKINNIEDEIGAKIINVKELDAMNRILEKEELNVKNATDFMKNLNLLIVEINALRGKSDKIKRQLNIDEKNFKKQQEYVTKLQSKYLDLCKNLQMSSDLSKIKEEIEENNKKGLLELQKFNQEVKKLRKNSKQDTPQFMLDDLIRLKTEPIVKKKRYASVKEYREDKDEVLEGFEKNPANAEKQFLNIRSRIKTTRKLFHNEEKTLGKALDEYRTQVLDMEFENKEIENKLKEKEKEVALANDMIKEMKKNTKYNALAPLNYSMTQTKEIIITKEKETKELEDFTNKSLIIKNSDARKRRTKRDSCGATLSYDVVFFDDVQAIGSCKKHQLKKITFFMDQSNIIIGLQATYIKHNELYPGYKNVMSSCFIEGNELIESTFELADDDYIRNVYGLYVDWIEYLRFETEKGMVFEVGVINKFANPKEFSLNIRNFDIPVTIFGALDIKKGGNGTEYVLAAIGIEMKNVLSERNEARSKDKLTKSQLVKDLLNFSHSSGRATSSSVDAKKKKKRYFLKKPDNFLIKEHEVQKHHKKGVAKDKTISLEKKGKAQHFSDLEESDEERKKDLKNKGKKNQKIKKDTEEEDMKTNLNLKELKKKDSQKLLKDIDSYEEMKKDGVKKKDSLKGTKDKDEDEDKMKKGVKKNSKDLGTKGKEEENEKKGQNGKKEEKKKK